MRAILNSFRTVCIILGILHMMPLVVSTVAAGSVPLNLTKTLDSDIIRLSDVFPDVPSSKDQVIGNAPAPGQNVILNARTLMKLAAAYGVKWQPATTADQVVLSRKGSIIDVATIQSAIMTALANNGVTGKFDLNIPVALTPMILPAETPKELDVSRVMIDPRTQSFTLRVAPRTMPAYGVDIQGTIEPLLNIPVMRQAVVKGVSIGAADLDTLEIRASIAGNDSVLSAQQLIGMTARRNILPGRIIKLADLETPLSVKRGEKVTLLYRQGVLELAAQGRAMQDGRKGDQIKVVNAASKTNLQGTVIADNQVIID